MSEEQASLRNRLAHCCCGALRAETIGEPLLVVACSCEQCQRRTGSVFGVSTYWMRTHVKTSGPTMCFVREAQEGRKVRFYFCPNCGSTVYWELPDLRPDRLGVAGGAFFDTDLPPPTLSVWERSRHDWVSVPAEHHFPLNGVLSSAAVPPER